MSCRVVRCRAVPCGGLSPSRTNSRPSDPPRPTNDDLKKPRQLKDKWGFRMTARYDLYARLLADYVRHDYAQQVVKDPSL